MRLGHERHMRDVLATDAELLESEGIDPAWPGFCKGNAATDPRWFEDPSPSWDQCANASDFEPLCREDTPDNPAGDVNAVIQKLWPLTPDTQAREESDGSG